MLGDLTTRVENKMIHAFEAQGTEEHPREGGQGRTPRDTDPAVGTGRGPQAPKGE